MPSAQYVVGEEAWFWGRFESLKDAVEDKIEVAAQATAQVTAHSTESNAAADASLSGPSSSSCPSAMDKVSPWQTTHFAPMMNQKDAAVQELCRGAGFGPMASECVAPCGLVALAVAKYIASSSSVGAGGEARAAVPVCFSSWSDVDECLGPLSHPAVLLPLLEETITDILSRRQAHIDENREGEFGAEVNGGEQDAEERKEGYRRGLVGPFEISAWLRRNSHLPVLFLRNVQCGYSAAGVIRWGATEEDMGADLFQIEKEWVREETPFRDPNGGVDFLIESAFAGFRHRRSSPIESRGEGGSLEAEATCGSSVTKSVKTAHRDASHRGEENKAPYVLRTPEKWALNAAAELFSRADDGRKSAVPIIVDDWGHFAVLLPVIVAGRPGIARIDSLPPPPSEATSAPPSEATSAPPSEATKVAAQSDPHVATLLHAISAGFGEWFRRFKSSV
jgi:hypothetical protein